MWKFFISGIEVNEPIGWDAVQFTIERKPDAGFSFVFSDTVTFQNKAADIIRQAYNQRFVNALVPIDIVRFKDGSCQQAIDRYSGVLNFKVYQEEGQDVIIGIMDSGIAEKFTANKGTKINLRNETNADGVELTPLSNDLFDLHSQPLQARTNYLINNDVELLITGEALTVGQCGYIYDGFYGVNFVGHPNLKRILNVDEMDYFPLRKEFPLEDQTRIDKDDEMFGRGGTVS
jgi:hypothetical protein